MSDIPLDADELLENLASTEVDPTEMRDLLVLYHADLKAVKVLCDHPDERAPLLAAVFAAREQVMFTARRQPELRQSANKFDEQVNTWLRAQLKDVIGPDLGAVLLAVRTLFQGQSTSLFRDNATWFLENVPLPVLTDEVVAEMSIWEDSYPGPSLELGAGWPPENRNTGNVGCWLISRYVYNRFGEHGPSWDVFVRLYDSEWMSIGAAAAEVEELHNRFGEHGPSWDLLVELIVSQRLWIREAADQVAYPHTLFGTDDASWTMLMGIYSDGSQTVAEVADKVAALESPNS